MMGGREIWMRLRSYFGSDPAARLDDEIAAHASLLAEEYVARGMSQNEAQHAALRELGNLTAVKQQYREQSGLPLLENLWFDLKYTVRGLRRDRTYTAACVATLTVGLGALIAVLCIVSTLLWQPLPYRNPQSLAVLNETDPKDGWWSFSEPMLMDLQQRSTAFEFIAGYRFDTLPLTGQGDTEAIRAAAVTPSLFKVFGIAPLLGATFQDTQPKVFISRALWRRKWAENPQILGSTIVLAGEKYAVAGAGDLPVDLFPGVELFYPLKLDPAVSRSAHEVEAVARLRNGVSLSQAQAELNTVAAEAARSFASTQAGWSLHVRDFSSYILAPGASRMLWMILAAVGLLCLLACVNAGGLQIARSVTRQQETGTRLALGASRGRLLLPALIESSVLAAAGTILGALLAQFAVAAVREWGAPYFPRLDSLQLSPQSVAIAGACLLISMAIFALLSHQVALSKGVRHAGVRPLGRRTQGRDLLIVIQVALASVLLLGATLLFQSFIRLRSVDPGFNPDRVLSVRVNLPASARDEVRRIAFVHSATESLVHLPGVESVGASNVVPFSGHGTANRFRVEGEGNSEYHSAAWRAVTPDFFHTLGIPLKRGRWFTDADDDNGLQVVIVSESMARRFWPNQDPIGQRLLWGRSGNPKTIVGVVGDLRDLTVDAPPQPTMFRPFPQLSNAPMTLLIKTRQDPSASIPIVRRRLWALNRDAALECQALRDIMSGSLLRPQASLLAVGAFALAALLTAAMGLYGAIAYRVNQRRQEIGIRCALGATPAAIHWSFQRRCLVLVLTGFSLGLPLAFGFSAFIASLLYQTKPTQPEAYLSVLGMFAAVGLAASFAPALQAARLDPSTAIRYE